MEKYRHSIPLSSRKLDKPAATSSSNRCFQERKTRPSQYFSIMDDTVSTNRSSNKRPSSTSPSLQIAAPKRRVVLGELTNSPIQNSDRKKPMRKNNMMKKEMEVQETEIVASSVDQTKFECLSSIHQHLHSLEMLEMERDVVKFLNSDTGPPTTKNFLRQENGSLQALEINKSLALQLYSGYRPSDLKMCGLAIQQKIKLSASDKRKVHETKEQERGKTVFALGNSCNLF